MTHRWREHIKITKKNNPSITNFGEIIKLAKETYTKNTKKIKKGGNPKKEVKTKKNHEENKIFADKIDRNGVSRKYKEIQEGECIFPFKYNKKEYNVCAETKSKKDLPDRWCPTSLNEKGYAKTWGYCETHLNKMDKTEHEKDSSSKTEDSSSSVKTEDEKEDSSSVKTKDVTDDAVPYEDSENQIVTNILEYGKDKYLLDSKTRNIYSLPEEDGTFYFVGILLPNDDIDFDAEEYENKEDFLEDE